MRSGATKTGTGSAGKATSSVIPQFQVVEKCVYCSPHRFFVLFFRCQAEERAEKFMQICARSSLTKKGKKNQRRDVKKTHQYIPSASNCSAGAGLSLSLSQSTSHSLTVLLLNNSSAPTRKKNSLCRCRRKKNAEGKPHTHTRSCSPTPLRQQRKFLSDFPIENS